MSVRVTVDRSNGRTNILDLNFLVEINNATKLFTSPHYFCGTNYIQVQIINLGSGQELSTCVRFNKLLKQDVLLYICKVSSGEKKISFTKDGIWHQVFCHVRSVTRDYKFALRAIIDVAPTVNTFAFLHDDTELTDFKLQCSKGTVNVHKSVLACASPVFHKMLIGKWKESNEGSVDFPVARIEDLENFKVYMYLLNVPEEVRDLENLFELGSCYVMPELLQRCTVKMINKLSEDNVLEMIVTANKLKANDLFLYILKHIESNTLDFDKMFALAEWNEVYKPEYTTIGQKHTSNICRYLSMIQSQFQGGA